MLTKILAGGMAITLVGLAIVFNMLLASREANGRLESDVRKAEGVNERQELVVDRLRLDAAEKEAAYVAEQLRAKIAVNALITSQAQLRIEQDDFSRRLAAARLELSDEEMVCSEQPIPAAFIDSLRE